MQRIFIGVPVDQRPQSQINELLEPLKSSIRDIRWVAEQNRHLTLAFLGDQPPRVVGALIHSMDVAYQRESAFQTVFSSLLRFPHAKGNILALVCAVDDRLARLYKCTCELLARHGLAPDYSTFRPHITVGRIARPGRLKTRFNQPAEINLRIDKVALYQSTLTRTGSIYSALKLTGLGQADARPG